MPIGDTPFLRVRAALAVCDNMTDMLRVWIEQALTLKAMPEADRNALVAMKDFYKGMIFRGEINNYLAIRRACENIESNAS
jgi:hypothetical protein